jgi:hypothetical protein
MKLKQVKSFAGVGDGSRFYGTFFAEFKAKLFIFAGNHSAE